MNIFLKIAGILLGFTPLYAETLQVDLSILPKQLLQHHQELLAAKWQVEIAKGRLLGSGRLSNPEIEIELLHDRRYQAGNMAITLSQSFPITSRLDLEKMVSANAILIAQWEIAEFARLKVLNAQELMIEWLALRDQQQLRIQQLKLSQELTDNLNRRMSVGEASALDLAQLQLEKQQLELDQSQAQLQLHQLQQQLRAALGLPVEKKLQLTGKLPALLLPNSQSPQRPDQAIAQHLAKQAQVSLQLAEAKRYEDWKAGITWEGDREKASHSGYDHTGMIGFKLSIPLPLRNRNEGEIYEKQAEIQQQQQQIQALQSQIQLELQRLKQEMQGLVKLEQQTRETLLPLASQHADQLERAYQQGQKDLIELLRARDQILRFKMSIIDLKKSFQLARVRYDAALGLHVKSLAPKELPPL